MTVHIAFETCSAAFDGEGRGEEIARILRDLALRLETRGDLRFGYETAIRDVNGNGVGNCVVSYRFEEEEES